MLQRLKADPQSRSIPVVVLTSSDEQKDIVESYNLGVNSYIVKPVEFEGFMAAVGAARHVLAALESLRGARRMSARLRLLILDDSATDGRALGARADPLGPAVRRPCAPKIVRATSRRWRPHRTSCCPTSTLQEFNGLDALQLLKQRHPHVPFILVSGATR